MPKEETNNKKEILGWIFSVSIIWTPILFGLLFFLYKTIFGLKTEFSILKTVINLLITSVGISWVVLTPIGITILLRFYKKKKTLGDSVK